MKFSIQALYSWYRGLLRNPKYRWWVILGTILYFVSPFDIAPDFFPVIGEVDDVFLMTLLVSEISQMMIEGFKARKDKDNVEVSSPVNTEGSTTTTTTDTIDVDSVPVK
jgi:uncharacterized membrane protein YkvA (DUF1232 family)